MEAAFCLGYGSSSSISLRIPSTTKLHFGFNPSLSVSSGFSSRRKCHHFYSTSKPLLALDRSNNSMPSANEKGGVSKVVRGAAGASLALACALSIIGCSSKMDNFKAIAGPKQHIYQKAPSFQQIAPLPTPRKMALKSLLDVTVGLSSKEGRKKGSRDVNTGPPIPGPSSRHLPPSKGDIDELKEVAVNQMKAGQPEKAISTMEIIYKRYELSDPETSFNITMALIEILICQGKYKEAYEYLRKQEQGTGIQSEFELRPILYKAIVCTMLDKDEEAQKSWEDFASALTTFNGPFG